MIIEHRQLTKQISISNSISNWVLIRIKATNKGVKGFFALVRKRRCFSPRIYRTLFNQEVLLKNIQALFWSSLNLEKFKF